jgi:hypothetical protein
LTQLYSCLKPEDISKRKPTRGGKLRSVKTDYPRVALVSCVKRKLEQATAAEDLYISDLFLSMRRYAEQVADQWFILSAEHGLLQPEEIVAPYERTLLKMTKADRTAWAQRVQAQLVDVLPPQAEVILLAGMKYRDDLLPFLRSRGHVVHVPMAGMPLGRQLQWLKEQTR